MSTLPRKWSVRLLACTTSLVALSVGVSAFAVEPAIAASAATSSPCADVYFVSARGSGQQVGSSESLDTSPETGAVLAGVQKALGSAGRKPDVRVHQLAYPAPSVNVLTAGLDKGSLTQKRDRFFNVNLPAYLSMEREGESELAAYITGARFECFPTGRKPVFVLAGYSQGSMVVHNYLQRVADSSDTDLKVSIAGAVLVADPERSPRSQVTNFGTAPSTKNSYGVCHALDLVPGNASCLVSGQSREVPATFLPITYQVCMEGDLVCDAGSLARYNTPAGYRLAAQTGSFIHSNCHAYCTGKRTLGPTGLAGQRVGRYLVKIGIASTPTSTPTPTPTPTPISTAPKIASATFVNAGVSLSFVPPSSIASSSIIDYKCKASPDGGATIYPCNAGGGANGGIGTSSPAVAPASIYIGPGSLRIGLGWSMAMAAVTSGGVQSFGPWFTIVNNPLRPPTIRLASVNSTDMTLAFDPPPALVDLTITDYICEVSPDNGNTVYTCDGGANGIHGSVGLTSPAKLPKSIYYNPGYYEIVAGWSIRMRAVSSVIDSPQTNWFQIT